MKLSSPSSSRRRIRTRVHGTVQGVGFRPYVYRLAGELGLSGYVLNDSQGVLLEAEGDAVAVQEFLARLELQAPPLAVLETVSTEECQPTGAAGFTIRESPRRGVPDAPVTPDSATCEACLAELLDPGDRRHRYPFINCTNCGPRFTIVRGVPYDRPLTTMAGFAMCQNCLAEYEDPGDRRFHAQPNACPVCGPSVSLLRRDGSLVGQLDLDHDAHGAQAPDGVQAAAMALHAGQIVAIKGTGGYHLACRADDARAVAALRARKDREAKPFALMAASTAEADRLVWLGAEERALLNSPARPIVLAPRRAQAPIVDAVAPGAPELGLMLPYSPLHHILLADVGTTLVLTSGNVSDEPIAYRDDDALARLHEIADLFLVHDRPIQTRTDDSVVRVWSGPTTRRTMFLRRSRGYVPGSLPLLTGSTERPLLACGAELKNTFCLAKGERAWVGHHIGDLENYETLGSFTEGIEHFQRLFAVQPELVAHDLHPGYLSTAYALERTDVDHIGVQHHHAHLAACLAEHGHDSPAVGAIFDGTGYGTDGTVWGGELLVGGLTEFDRAGSLWPVRMPGGAAAIRQPWRMAAAWLQEAFGEPRPLLTNLADKVDSQRWRAIGQIGTSASVSPLTTSMGRLFDAIGTLCGAPAEVSYEGQAAVELEALAWAAIGARAGAGILDRAGAYEIEIGRRGGGVVLDPRAAVREIVSALEGGADVRAVAAGFHAGMASAAVLALTEIAGARGVGTVVLSGGVFQNRLLLEAVAAGLDAAGLLVLVPERLPPNDGGISFGQAAVAAARDRAGCGR